MWYFTYLNTNYIVKSIIKYLLISKRFCELEKYLEEKCKIIYNIEGVQKMLGNLTGEKDLISQKCCRIVRKVKVFFSRFFHLTIINVARNLKIALMVLRIRHISLFKSINSLGSHSFKKNVSLWTWVWALSGCFKSF